MSAKRWVLVFLFSLLLVAVLLAGFNLLTDPFGVFGDPLLDWYSYNETQNPRVAKIAWLQQGNHRNYDSYIIGCSGSSSIPVEAFNEALDARFYNMIMYGADLLDVEQTAQYLADHFEVKNLVLSLYVDNGISYNAGEDNRNQRLHPDVSGSSALRFYADHLLLAPQHGLEKLRSRLQDTDLPQSFDVFDEDTGAYDKRRRDAESIGDLASYLEAYPVFADYPTANYAMTEIDGCVKSITAIRELCEARGINLLVVMNPVYADHLAYYSQEDLAQFAAAIAEVTPYWDFSLSSISYEPRYFYDATHFRNSVGEMMAARIFGKETIWVPKDFGQYVTAENVAAHAERYEKNLAAPVSDYTAKVQILMYHALDETGEGTMSVTPETFRCHMEALKQAGYHTVSLQELCDYVNRGAALPEKPLVITFDDGYASNYELAYPILKELDMKATIFAIGVSMGKDTYKNTDHAMTPHFGWEETREMIESGLISVYSHTYDMHQWPPFEPNSTQIRETAKPFPDESEADYAAAFTADLRRSMEDLERETGLPCLALAYPMGEAPEQSRVLAAELGIQVTMSTVPKDNTILRGLPQSLYLLGRYSIDDISAEDLLEKLQ